MAQKPELPSLPPAKARPSFLLRRPKLNFHFRRRRKKAQENIRTSLPAPWKWLFHFSKNSQLTFPPRSPVDSSFSSHCFLKMSFYFVTKIVNFWLSKCFRFLIFLHAKMESLRATTNRKVKLFSFQMSELGGFFFS